jgi:hypothetical protein
MDSLVDDKVGHASAGQTGAIEHPSSPASQPTADKADAMGQSESEAMMTSDCAASPPQCSKSPSRVASGRPSTCASPSEPTTIQAAVDTFVVAFLRASTPDTVVADALVRRWKAKDTTRRLAVALEPKKPKRVVSKYLYFCRRVRQEILAESPGTNIRDVTRELGRRWRAFQAAPDADFLAEISAEFTADAARYRKERATRQSVSKKRAAPKSPFIAFCTAERRRAQVPSIGTAGEALVDMVRRLTLKELGARWRAVKTDPIEYERYRAIAGCA